MSIRNDFRFFRCDPRVAIRHFDSTTGVVAGDADLGVGVVDDRLAALRLPAGRVISISPRRSDDRLMMTYEDM